MKQHSYERKSGERLAIGLGWFSIGLGLTEICATRSLARLIGVPERDRTLTTLRALGVREVGHGVAILAQPDSAARVWARVAGDALDLSVLGAAMADEESDRTRVSAAIGAVLGAAALDVMCAQQLSGRSENGRRGGSRGLRDPNEVRVERVTTINRPVHEVYEFWRRFENLPRFMRHLESVEMLENGRSRWRAKGPAGMTFEWNAEILQEREGEWIAWRSVEGSDVQNSGSVRFQAAPGARGTEIRVQLQYSPPAGAFGRTIAKLFGEEPSLQMREDLNRFKQVMETGEVTRSDGSPDGARLRQHPAQPAAR